MPYYFTVTRELGKLRYHKIDDAQRTKRSAVKPLAIYTLTPDQELLPLDTLILMCAKDYLTKWTPPTYDKTKAAPKGVIV